MHLATGNNDGYIRIWNVATGTEVQAFLTSASYGVFGLAWSPDQRFLATISGRRVEILNADTGAYVRKCEIPDKGSVSQVVWNPTGTRLVGIGGIGLTRYVWLWDAETGDLLNAFSS